NHKSLGTSGGKSCISCHKDDEPGDSLHRQSQAGCGTCHSSSRWKPASFDHSRYFRLDRDHKVSCTTCHTDSNNYKKYTCYNCHEHSEARMAHKHRRISNYQNCVRCHRNGEAEDDD
ncbi:MAG: cytochrome c3 family protein, partial [Chlorobium sp.]